MRIAIWQTPSPAGDTARALSDLTQAQTAAAAMGAQMLVTPEVFLPGYNQPTIPGQSRADLTRTLAPICRSTGCGVTLGYAELDGTLHNSALTLDAQGRELAHYRKVQLYGPREKSLYTPGDSYAVFDLHGLKTAL